MVELEHGDYCRLVLEVPDPDAEADRIRKAAGSPNATVPAASITQAGIGARSTSMQHERTIELRSGATRGDAAGEAEQGARRDRGRLNRLLRRMLSI